MAKKIKSLDELPTWFDLKHFDYLQGLGAAGWEAVMTELYALSADDLANQLSEAKVAFSLDDLFAAPLVDQGTEESHRYRYTRYKTDPGNFMFRGVSALSNGVVAYMANEMRAMPQARFLFDRLKASPPGSRRHGKPLTIEQAQFRDRPFFLTLQDIRTARGDRSPLTNNRAIAINMELPDAMLLEDFQDWLKASRALTIHPKTAPRMFSGDDFVRWCDDQFVPYSVLAFWAKAVGAEISHNVMAAALFPRRSLITEANIRRTIRPAWKAWLCPETIAALRAQAAKEMASIVPSKTSAAREPATGDSG